MAAITCSPSLSPCPRCCHVTSVCRHRQVSSLFDFFFSNANQAQRVAGEGMGDDGWRCGVQGCRAGARSQEVRSWRKQRCSCRCHHQGALPPVLVLLIYTVSLHRIPLSWHLQHAIDPPYRHHPSMSFSALLPATCGDADAASSCQVV